MHPPQQGIARVAWRPLPHQSVNVLLASSLISPSTALYAKLVLMLDKIKVDDSKLSQFAMAVADQQGKQFFAKVWKQKSFKSEAKLSCVRHFKPRHLNPPAVVSTVHCYDVFRRTFHNNTNSTLLL